MSKKIPVFIITYIVMMLLVSCQKANETVEETSRSETIDQVKVKQLDAIINNNIETDQKKKKLSAMEKIRPEVLASLDLISDYDKDAWWAPEKWNEELWDWKILLKWDRECDYAPGVSEYPLHESQYTFITIQCSGGAYQPMSYAYLLDKNTKESIQLKLGRGLDSPEPSREIWGEIAIDEDTNQLSIYYVVRGIRDCGVYQKYNLVEGDSVETSNFVVKTTRKQECLEGMRYEDLPDSVFDYKNWPLVDE